VKRAWPIAVLAAAVAAPIAASDDPGAPTAELTVTPTAVTQGQAVTLDASASRDDGTIASYAWDLDGDGSFERVGGTGAKLEQTLSAAGEIRLGVRVVDDSGLTSDAFQSVSVQAKPKEIAPEPEPAAPAQQPERKAAPAKQVEAAAPAQPKARPKKRRVARTDTTVRAASSTTVSIRDFSFAPSSVTINVGDSVTWRNTGDQVHTATGGVFNTGNLSSGQSGSHTFSSAGTFSYKCTPHPFMTGTVKVVAAGGGGGGGGTGSASNGGGTGTGDTGSAGSDGTGSTGDLPSTGLGLGALALPGLVMLLTGLTLRRRVTLEHR
jgi:plastocyanin